VIEYRQKFPFEFVVMLGDNLYGGDIYYFTEGASGSLRSGNLKETVLTAAGYDQDRSFMLIEIAGDELYFQTISRTGRTVDSGVIRRAATIGGVASGPAEWVSLGAQYKSASVRR
jgi:hypothetical protein